MVGQHKNINRSYAKYFLGIDDPPLVVKEHSRHTGRKLVELLMKDKTLDGFQLVKVLEFILSPPTFVKLTNLEAAKNVQLSKIIIQHISPTMFKLLCKHGYIPKVFDVNLAMSRANGIAVAIMEALPIGICIDYTQLCNIALQSPHIRQELVVYLLNQGAKPESDVLRLELIDNLEMLNQLSTLYCLNSASHASLLHFFKRTMQLKSIKDCISMYKPLGVLLKLVKKIKPTIDRVAPVPAIDHESLSEDEVISDTELNPVSDISGNPEEPMYHELGDLPWEVECTSNVHKILNNKHFPAVLRKSFFSKIHQIASGDRTEALQKSVTKEKGAMLYEAKLSKAARIIWEEAKQFSPKLSQGNQHIYTEVIRVWDIVIDHDNLHRKITRVSKQRNNIPTPIYHEKSSVYLSCTTECESSGITQKLPRRFTKADTNNDSTTAAHEVCAPAVYQNENGYSVAKFYSCSSEFAASLLTESDEWKDFPLKVSPEEHDIINMSWPQKEPILLLGRSGTGKTICCLYRMWKIFRNVWKVSNEASLHQIFITKSKNLCDYTKKYFYSMAASQEYLHKHMPYKDKKLPNTLSSVSNHAYPLFLTSKEFLVLLDNSLNAHHFFPRDADGNVANELNRIEVTARYFERDVWPKLKNKMDEHELGHFNPTLVWMEIISIIKGSFDAIQQPMGYLSREQYISIGQKMAPNFSQGDRKYIYSFFLKYQGYLQNNSAFDECDIVCNLYHRILRAQPSWKISYFYVDEVQDFTQAELSIIAHLSSEPNNLFLTGDTAQTITKGVYFRFCDLQSLFWHIQKLQKVTIPEIKTLKMNFRSHSGILNLAASVIDLMHHFFSKFFDSHLPTDKGIFPGPKPTIFVSETNEEIVHSFGANQVVIVRNDLTKEQLINSKQLEGIILTVHEAKGMEFTDVLLYNIFDAAQVSVK